MKHVGTRILRRLSRIGAEMFEKYWGARELTKYRIVHSHLILDRRGLPVLVPSGEVNWSLSAPDLTALADS